MDSRNDIRLWRDANVMGGLEMLRASFADYSYPPHSHDFYVIAAFKRGAQRHTIARHQGVAYPGTVMIIAPGEVHTGEAAERGLVWEYSAFYPQATVLENIAQELLGPCAGPLCFGSNVLFEDRELNALLLNAHFRAEASGDALEREYAVYGAFEALVNRYGQRAKRRTSPAYLRADISRALDFMQSGFSDALSVAQIAATAGLSEYHFMRVFRATMGMTVHRYLMQLRLMRAKNLLQRGESAVNVALVSGFFDQSHFSKQFRLNFGVTPRQFANACC